MVSDYQSHPLPTHINSFSLPSPGVQTEVGHAPAPAPVQGGQWGPAPGAGASGWGRPRPRGGPLPDLVINAARVGHLKK